MLALAIRSTRLAGLAQGLRGAGNGGGGQCGDPAHGHLVRCQPALPLAVPIQLASLLLLVPVVALPCGWLNVEIEWARAQHEAAHDIDGWNVSYDDTDRRWYESRFDVPAWQPPPSWACEALGDDFFRHVIAVHLLGRHDCDGAWNMCGHSLNSSYLILPPVMFPTTVLAGSRTSSNCVYSISTAHTSVAGR